ncbi:unnamed protein product [Vicia faba]|uniref:Uncharacterized protein n=1 Tax=Vicia faba TaxID=3906 RepID=A0AAV0ZZU0_VICFA|nr:unnamed protein product [Vicia faba]
MSAKNWVRSSGSSGPDFFNEIIVVSRIFEKKKLDIFNSLLQALFIKEHNAVCDMLKKHYPDFDDEQLYRLAGLLMACVEVYQYRQASGLFRLEQFDGFMFGAGLGFCSFKLVFLVCLGTQTSDSCETCAILITLLIFLGPVLLWLDFFTISAIILLC